MRIGSVPGNADGKEPATYRVQDCAPEQAAVSQGESTISVFPVSVTLQRRGELRLMLELRRMRELRGSGNFASGGAETRNPSGTLNVFRFGDWVGKIHIICDFLR